MRMGLWILPWLVVLALAGCNNGGTEASSDSQPAAAPVPVEAGKDALAPLAAALAAPAGVTANGGNGQVLLSWSPVPGAASYDLYWSTNAGAGTGGTRIAGVTSPYVHDGLVNRVTTYYVVTAAAGRDESAPSAEASATPMPLPPPADVSAGAGEGRVTLAWRAVAGATGYNVYVSLAGGAGTTGTLLAAAGSPYTVTGLTDGTNYYFVVTAVGRDGESLASVEAQATPGVPAGSLDPAFNATGVATFVVASAVSGIRDQGVAVATDSASRPVLLSSAAVDGVPYQVTSRWTDSGLADMSFGKTPPYSLEPDTPGGVNPAGGSGASPIALALDGAGRQYVVGSVTAADGSVRMALWRYAPGARDGQADPAFGGGTGVVVSGSPLGGGTAAGLAVAVDSLGRIVVGGYSTDRADAAYATVWRFNGDGTPDATFGANGDGVSFQTIYGAFGTAGPLPGAALGGYATPGDSISSLAIDSQNRIVLLGHTQDALGHWGLFLARLTAGSAGVVASGGLSDYRTFGVTYNYTAVFNTLGGNYDWGTALAQDGAGTRQLVTGYAWSAAASAYFMTVWGFANNGRYDGVLDPGFGTAGHSARIGSAGGTQGEFGFAIAVDGQRRIVVAGQSATRGGGGVMTVWRMLANGAPDPAFTAATSVQAGAVWVSPAAGGNYDVGLGLALDGRGRIVVSGYSYTSIHQSYVAVLWRLMP